MIETTVLQVEKRKVKVWVLKETQDKTLQDFVGQVTASGTPCSAKLVPIGTTYTSTLFIPTRG